MAALPHALSVEELTARAALSHRLLDAACHTAAPMSDAPTDVVRLADGDAVATALALSYALRRGDTAADGARYRLAARVLARALDRIRATTP